MQFSANDHTYGLRKQLHCQYGGSALPADHFLSPLIQKEERSGPPVPSPEAATLSQPSTEIQPPLPVPTFLCSFWLPQWEQSRDSN